LPPTKFVADVRDPALADLGFQSILGLHERIERSPVEVVDHRTRVAQERDRVSVALRHVVAQPGDAACGPQPVTSIESLIDIGRPASGPTTRPSSTARVRAGTVAVLRDDDVVLRVQPVDAFEVRIEQLDCAQLTRTQPFEERHRSLYHGAFLPRRQSVVRRR
jgi:hypothetical protein